MRKWFRFVSYLFVSAWFSQANAGAYEDFFKAVILDDAGTVSALMGRGFDPNSPDERGQVALYLAMREPSPQVAAMLWARPDLKIDALNTVGETSLMMAALRGNLDWVQRLLDRGAAINKEGWTPLHYAASGPQPAVLSLLLDRGAQIDALSPKGTTSLMLAAQYGSEESVFLLLKRGANANLRDPRGLGVVDFARLGGRESLQARLSASAR